MTELPQILSRAGSLPAYLAWEGAPIRHSHILIAPPDQHLLVSNGHVHLSSGPRENRQRPAIDTLFRSASVAYGDRVVGILLSGVLDDGTVGLWEIKRRGGVAIVQHPKEALFPDVVLSALDNVNVDFTLSSKDISALLTNWSKQPSEPSTSDTSEEHMNSQPTRITCPECRGPLEEISYDNLREYRCRVGHRYTAESMLVSHAETEERTLWAGVVALEEGAELLERLANNRPLDKRANLLEEIQVRRKFGAELRAMIEQLNQIAARITNPDPARKTEPVSPKPAGAGHSEGLDQLHKFDDAEEWPKMRPAK